MKTIKLKKQTLLLTIAVLMSATLFAQQQGNDNNKPCTTEKRQKGVCQKAKMAQYLQLSDEQQSNMAVLRLNHQKAVLPLKNVLNEKRAKLTTLSTAENADMKAINKLIDEIGLTKTDVAKLKAAHHQEVRKILTEEQRIKFDMQRQKKGNGHGKSKGQGRGNC